MNRKHMALFSLKHNPFSPDVPVEALYRTPKMESFCFRIEQLVGEGGFGLITASPGMGKSATLRVLAERLSGLRDLESRGGAVTVGRARLLPPLSSGGVSIARPWFRFHLPLIEPGGPLSGTGLSDKASGHRTREIMPHGIADARVPAFYTGTRTGSVSFPYWQFCACCITTGAADAVCSSQSPDRIC